MRHILTGKIGERHALRYLRREGFEILSTNYRTFVGEIDIIAKERDTLAFVEVKTRSSRNYGLPQEAVHERKKRQIIRSALAFLQERGEPEALCRFDVVAVFLGPAGSARHIDLIRNAFDASSP